MPTLDTTLIVPVAVFLIGAAAVWLLIKLVLGARRTDGAADERPAGWLAAGLAAQFPSTHRQTERLEALLRRAGYYSPHAVTHFRANRNVLVLGAVLVAAGAVTFLGPEQPVLCLWAGGIGTAAALLAFSLPLLRLQGEARRRVERIERGLPDALDMLSMCLAGGLSLRGSVSQIGRGLTGTHPDLAGELDLVDRQAGLGSLTQAVQQMGERLDSHDVRAFAGLVADTEAFGVDVQAAGREQADSIRRSYRQRADERSAGAAMKLILPFGLCLMPAVMLLLWAPAVLQMHRFLADESRPGGAFSQDLTEAAGALQQEFNIEGGNQDLPIYRGQRRAAVRRQLETGDFSRVQERIRGMNRRVRRTPVLGAPSAGSR